MASFICLGCRQPVQLRTNGNQPVPPELQYCLKCAQLRARFERDVADARAGKALPNSEYWLDKTWREAGFDDELLKKVRARLAETSRAIDIDDL
jgi:hypothetical protein